MCFVAYIGSAGVLPVMLGTSELELPAAAFQGLESLQPLVLTLLSDQQLEHQGNCGKVLSTGSMASRPMLVVGLDGGRLLARMLLLCCDSLGSICSRNDLAWCHFPSPLPQSLEQDCAARAGAEAAEGVGLPTLPARRGGRKF